ncbi:MAG: polysaccharide deacetylase family protein [Candidatus Fimenecus sp.]
MRKTVKIIGIMLSLSLLCSCVRTKYEPISDETYTEKPSERSYSPETTVSPEPLADNGKKLSTEKKSHSYGVAKNGEAHEISKNAQKYFEQGGFNAFCLDTKSQNKVLYLTFDCGYENGYTSKILDVLKEKNVNAAFFCTLPQVKENPELIKRMIDEGHIVGNHSVTHPSFAEITKNQMADEIKTMDAYLRENFNYSEPYFRFPKGEYNEVALSVVDSLGYKSVFWSLSYADWDLNNQKGEQYAYETVISRLHPGAVILLHSVSPDNANALSRIIDKAREEGYSFMSLRDFPQN